MNVGASDVSNVTEKIPMDVSKLKTRYRLSMWNHFVMGVFLFPFEIGPRTVTKMFVLIVWRGLWRDPKFMQSGEEISGKAADVIQVLSAGVQNRKLNSQDVGNQWKKLFSIYLNTNRQRWNFFCCFHLLKAHALVSLLDKSSWTFVSRCLQVWVSFIILPPPPPPPPDV